MSYKYKFAGKQALQALSLEELRKKLSDPQLVSDDVLAAELLRLFKDWMTNGANGELLDWLFDIGEKEIGEKLERGTRTPIPLAAYLLGDDSLRLERIIELLRERMSEENKSPVAATNPPKLPLYRVLDLTNGTISGLEATPSDGWTDEYKTSKLVLRRIDPGDFLMGSPSDESGRGGDETQHRVQLTKPYYMGVFAVTQRQWELIDGSFPANFWGATRPVECVSYDLIRGRSLGSYWPDSSAVDADSFLGKLRKRTGCEGFDLPTEAQWEYACRAGTKGNYFRNLDDMGWYDKNSGGATHKVGEKRPNAWGIYDMHGNVREWCLDWKGDYGGDATDPKGPASGIDRVSRGGSWFSNASFCRSANRNYDSPGHADDDLGFRLCCSAGSAV